MKTTRRRDPRLFQIAALSVLLTIGTLLLGFEFHLSQTLAVVATALFVQALASRWAGIAFDPRSALITSLSLTLLLRTGAPMFAVLAAAMAIGSKFLIRVRGKHVFNPANFALVALMLVTDQVWVSSGQWGSAMLGAVVVAALGLIVLNRARYAETPLAFIATFALLLSVRALWLGDPWTLVTHQLANGALLVFTFFMISDPKTAPDRALARVLYGATVAAIAFVLDVFFFVTAAPVWALGFAAPLVPLLDACWRAPRYRWSRTAPSATLTTQGL
ncbi:MAG: RnfABCDGE type electron transport complex subunit D [Pseudomonadota bacterium]